MASTNLHKDLRIAAIIPARYASSRFPGKPLALIKGKTLIQRTYEQAIESKLCQTVIVATDDKRIFNHVIDFGGVAVMTSPDHLNGSERIAEVVQSMPNLEIIANIQGDEPLINPSIIDRLIEPLIDRSELEMVTLASPLIDKERIESPSVVKVVIGQQDKALYFSRSPIPHYRNTPKDNLEKYFKHDGIYIYRRKTLLKLIQLEPSPLELAEGLEQLRALENGISIHVVKAEHYSPAVDVPEDIALVEESLEKSSAKH